MGKYRNGQTFVGVWVPDEMYQKWRKFLPNKKGLSEYMRQAVDEKITRESEQLTHEVESKKLAAEKAGLEKIFEARFAEMKQILSQGVKPAAAPANAQMPVIKSRILKFLDALKPRAARWENIADVVGDDRDLVLNALGDLLNQTLIDVNEKGDYYVGGN
jgi:hypothetical protein